MQVDGDEHELTRSDAVALREAISDAVTETREFFRTAGTYREDGSYEVSRRGADSSGNAKVFDSFDAVCRLYDRLPGTFSADDVEHTGITGSRKHMLVRHFAEHPAFDCEIESRSPLTATKVGDDAEPPDERAEATGPSATAD
ncbi:DUF7528 family protein [Halostella litorea]|uniref:DUF7528 family protein n=1 Tax=Halostella litorea TaxID=2528831 RepID=UPI0010920B99|nr:hypothetical protein [Halostella litorea]